MMHSLARIASRLLLSLVVVVASVLPMQAEIALAQTVPTSAGTVISNTASATYQDGSGNSYTTVSNQVQTTVQFAPSLTNTGQTSNQSVAPNDTVADPFTLKNTGNGTGYFQITAPTLSAGTVVGYAIVGSTTCTVAAPCTLANVNTALQALSTAPGSTQTVDVVYTAPAANGPPQTAQTITDQLSSTVTYPPGTTGPTSGLTQQTSAAATATDTDTVNPDARLDLQKTAVSPTSSTAPITFYISGNDGGSFPAYGSFDSLALVKTTPGTGGVPNETKPGILITDKIPAYSGTTLSLASAASVALNGATTGTTAKVIYTTDTTGASGWTETYAAGTAYAYVGVYIQNATAAPVAPAQTVPLLPSNPGGSTGAGAVTGATATPPTTPQVVLTLNLTQPTANGSANAGVIKNLANSVIAGTPDAQGNSQLLGPGIPPGTKDTLGTGVTTPLTGATGPIQNTTPPTTGSNAAPGGASNQASTQSFAAQTVENGPAGSPAAQGSYNGTAAVNDNDDFTAVSAPCTNNGGVAVNTVPATANCTVAAINVPGEFQNTGNTDDTFTLTATPPAGYTAQIFPATCAGTPPYTTFPVCTKSSTTPITTGQPVSSGGTFFYVVTYTPTGNVTPFVQADGSVSVKGTGTNGTDTNVTHQDLIPGGPLQITKSVAVTSSGCPASNTAVAGGVCPGGVLTYSLAYLVAGSAQQVATGTGSTEPAFAVLGFEVGASTANPLTIYEDGTGTYFTSTTTTPPTGSTVASNNWATNTFGLQAAATDTNNLAAFTYYSGNPASATTTTFSTGAYPTPGAGPQSFIAKFTALLTPGTTGTISFKVQVK